MALMCSDGCFIGVEANGSVNSNRSQFGSLMNWRVYDADNLTSTNVISSSSSVVFESRLHNYMKAENGECHAKPAEIGPAHKFKVFYQGVKLDVLRRSRTPGLSFSIDGTPGTRTGYQLWANLRRTFRLRALAIRKEDMMRFRDDVETQRALMSQRKKEERQCIICWEEEPNTVCSGDLSNCKFVVFPLGAFVCHFVSLPLPVSLFCRFRLAHLLRLFCMCFPSSFLVPPL